MSLPPPPPPTTPPPPPLGGGHPAPPSGATVCYRHPNRPTGRRCTRCGRFACTDCLVQAAVGSHCVDCAKAARPDVKTRAKYWQARQPAMMTMALIAANLIVFLYTTARDPGTLVGRSVGVGQAQLALFEPALASDFVLPLRFENGATLIIDGPDWYRLVTSGFVHYGLIHLGFNMYLLYQLGNLLERSMGRVRFGLVYLASLLGGSALEIVLSSGGFAGGASGAVFGLMGVAAIGYWLRGVNPLSTQIGSLLLINLFLTFVISNISIGGHIGGLLAGAICGYAVVAPAHHRRPVWVTYAAPVAVALCAVAVSAALANT
jgi:membrane associated rhomboid family serine protease